MLVDVPSLSKPTGSTCAQNASVVPTGSRRGKIVELARNGRTPKELAEEFEPTQTTISGWPKQADRDEKTSSDGPTTGGREEIRWLRKKLRQLQQEQDILAKATAQSQEGDRRRPAQIFRFIDLS